MNVSFYNIVTQHSITIFCSPSMLEMDGVRYDTEEVVRMRANIHSIQAQNTVLQFVLSTSMVNGML